MNNNTLYQASPFLFIKKSIDNDVVLINNLLLKKELAVSTDVLDKLRKFNKPTEFYLIAEAINEVSLNYLISNLAIIESENIWKTTDIEAVEIEISTHCNWCCEYCPVRFDPKDKKTMDMKLFEDIIEKACRKETVKFVTFNSFNEPLLDIHFEERIKLLSKTNLKLILHTNGSALNKDKIKILKDSGVISVIYFNLPNLNEVKFKEITKSNTYKKTLENIRNTIEAGLNVEFSIQRVGLDDEENLNKMNERYSKIIGKPIELWDTCDRAGLIKNKYYQDVNISGDLFGCIWVLRWLFIGVDGECFICHHDYYQKEIYGNIKEGEIDDIMSSQKAQILRKNVFGEICANDSFICRKCNDMLEFSNHNSQAIKET